MQKMLGDAYPYVENVCDVNEINEIRIRLGQKILVKTYCGAFFVPFVADDAYIESVVDSVTNNSRYAFEETISEGYVDYAGGIRVGLVGEGWNNGDRSVFRKFYSLCIRIPHEIKSYSALPDELLNDFDNTLLVSPPGGGKTTLLRECAYRLSLKHDLLIIDERSEICGKNLVISHGKRADIIQGIPKKRAFETAIRTMAPEIVVCDELFGEEDFCAVERIIFSGIKVMATFHADGKVRPALDRLFANKIYLSSKPHPGSIKSISRNVR